MTAVRERLAAMPKPPDIYFDEINVNDLNKEQLIKVLFQTVMGVQRMREQQQQ
jgi:hypothetical protein